MMFVWTKAAEDRLRALWAAGHTASEIAHDLGNGSRSAVLGKVYRLGLPARSDEARARRLSASSRAARPPKTARLRVVAREGRLVEPLNLPFTDLDDNQRPTMCRFPSLEREGQQLFCAQPAEHGTSYCDDCCRVVYTADAYERQINKAHAQMRPPAGGRVLVAAPFSNRDYNVVGLVRECPFS